MGFVLAVGEGLCAEPDGVAVDVAMLLCMSRNKGELHYMVSADEVMAPNKFT